MTKFEDFAKHTVAMYQMFLAAQGGKHEVRPLTDPLGENEQMVIAAALAYGLQAMEAPHVIIEGVGDVTPVGELLPAEFPMDDVDLGVRVVVDHVGAVL